jgi:hypothetical protein
MAESTTTKSARPRWATAVVCAAAVAVAGLVLASSSATATVAVVCPGSGVTTYDPAVTNQPREVERTTTNVYGPCISRKPEIRSATAFAQSSGVRSCTSLFTAVTFDKHVLWNTDETSTIRLNQTLQFIDGNIVVVGDGVVTSGLFEGENARTTTILVTNPLGCFTSGVTSLFGIDTLTIL